MSKSVRIRRGTSIDHQQFAGAEGEITVDTTLDTIRVHDGVKLGGWPLLNTEKNSEIVADVLTANKIYFKNTFTNQGAFPSATTYPGMVAFSQADHKAYVSIDGVWTEITTPLDLVNYLSGVVASSGSVGDFSLAGGKTGSNAVIKVLRAGDNITLEADPTGVRISSAIYAGSNLNDGAGAYGVYSATDDAAHRLQFKSLRPGSGVSITPSVSGTELVVDTVLKQAFNTVRVDSTDIATTSVSNTLRLISGTGITLTPNVGDKSVGVNVSLSAVNDGTQTGSGVLKSYAAGAFTFNRLQAGAGVELSTGVNGEIVINAPQVGTITDAVNLAPPGPTSLGVYRSKVDGTLEFYNIAAGSNITIGYDQDNKNLVIEAAVGGAAGVGTVQAGVVNNLAYYPSTGTAVGDITDGASWDPINQRIIANIDGTVTDISNHTTDALDEGTTNVYWTQGRFDTALAGKTTSNLAEGTNLYFTNERAQDAVAPMFQLGNPNSTTVTATAAGASTSSATIFVNSTSGIIAGQTVVATGFPVGVTVQTVGATSFTVAPAVYVPSGLSMNIGGSLIVNASGSGTSTAQISVDSSTNIQTGWYVTGTGIQGRVLVQQVVGNLITLSPGYNATIPLGTVLTFKAVSSTGIVTTYLDDQNTFVYNLDTNYLGDFVRSQINVPTNSGIGYDPVQGRLTLSGAVTSVNGYSGAVTLSVGDITGAAPIASPLFTGTPRAATPDNTSSGFQIANKTYVDAAKLAVSGSPLPGLATIQALGNAINGDTLFWQTTQNSINSKLSTGGGSMSGVLILNYLVDSSSNNLTAVNKRYVDQVALVQSVNTKSGTIILNTDDIFERATPAPSNLWFTNARARSAISLTSSDTDVLSYNFNTGSFTFNKPTTDSIEEGANNKYFTSELARNSISVNVTGNTNFASYNALTGQIVINATSDNLSQGVTNRFYTDTLARNALSLGTSVGQNSLLTYNNGTGQFTVSAYTGNIQESAGGPYYFTGTRVNSSLAVSVTQLSTVQPTNILSTSYSAGTGVTTFTFNANSNSITEGSSNLYYTDGRARQAITISTTDSSVLNYNQSTGLITFNKPTTDGIAEGLTNKYFSNSLARNAISVTTTNTQNTGTAFVGYGSGSGQFTFNLNIDSLGDGATNKFASIGRVSSIIQLVTTNVNGGTTPLISYVGDAGQAKFTFNNSTDSLTEGDTNKWASALNVRSRLAANTQAASPGTTQQALLFNGGTSNTVINGRSVNAGNFDFSLFVDPKVLTWLPSADGTSSYHLTAVQDLRTTAKPTFNKVLLAQTNNISLVSATVMNVDCSLGSFFEFNRNGQVTNLTFTNVPSTAPATYYEVTISIYNGVGNTTGSNWAISNTSIKWSGAAAPAANTMSQTAGRRDIFKFYTIDAGGTWYELTRSLNVG